MAVHIQLSGVFSLKQHDVYQGILGCQYFIDSLVNDLLCHAHSHTALVCPVSGTLVILHRLIDPLY